MKTTEQHDENLKLCPTCQKQTDILHAGKCIACNMREQEEDDKKRWEGIELPPQPEIETIKDGPYKGFKMAKTVSKPNPEVAEKLRREAEEFEAQQAAWRDSLKMKRRM